MRSAALQSASYPSEVNPLSPQDMVNRLIDQLEVTKRMFAETRAELKQPEHAALVEVLHQCEQLTMNQIRLLSRALRRL